MAPAAEPGRIILIHGASSAGKSTLARSVQAQAPVPFWHYGFDTLRDNGVLPFEHPGFVWRERRAAVFDGLYRSVRGFAEAGNDLILETILDGPGDQPALREVLAGVDLFFVGLHLPLELLVERAAARDDRPVMAEADFALMQLALGYDLELDGREAPEANARVLLEAWAVRGQRSGFFG